MSEVQGAAPAAMPGVPGQSATAAAQPAVTPANGAPNQVAKPTPPELYEVKVNGQTRKYTLDELRNKAILADGAHEKFQVAAEERKQREAWKAKAQKDAIAALMDPELGLTKEQIKTRFESWYKENFIDPETMNEDQKRAAAAERRAAELEEREKTREEQEKTLRQQQEDQQMRQSVQEEIVKILDSSGLPKTRFTANRVAFWMKQNIRNGFEAPPEVIIQQVKDERNSIITSLIATATPEQLVEMLGDEVIKKLRTYDMGRLKQRFQPAQQDGALTPNTNGTVTRKPQGNRPMRDVDNYFNELRRSKK